MEHLKKMINKEVYIKIAKEIATCSKAERKKVGAIIVKNDNIISIGYNGTPSGWDNKCEKNNETIKEVLHAESNAILKCARDGSNCNGSILYLTLSPCFECAKLILQSGIKEVYYLEEYRNIDGLDFLFKSGITAIQL